MRALICFVFSLLLAPFGGARAGEAPLTPDAERRTEDQTFLTYPEWFLVYSPEEYAEHLEAHRPPSTFPYFGHVGQFWGAYRAIWRETSDRYAFNGEYHTMIGVIGVSTTVEYGLRGTYEKLIGRLTELAGGVDTAEDRLAAEVARDYVRFLDLEPWYKYDYRARLKQVWRAPWFGRGMLRKWERKYALTTEYGAKAIYGWLIGKATGASFAAPKPTTVVAIQRRGSGATELATLPRYTPFTEAATALANDGARFVEIAGNRGVILVTLRTPVAWRAPDAWPYRVLFEQPILTRPEEQRVALVVPVAELGAALGEMSRAPLVVEHVYDY